jgi:hypothetical protein
MKNIVRRIQQLEKQLLPAPETAPHRELIARLEAGRERVRQANLARGIPEKSDEGLPPKKVHRSRGIQLIMDVLHEGRDRARLRSIRDGKLRESVSMSAIGDD